MSVKTYSLFSTIQTPQGEPVPGKTQVQNNAGGYVFQLDDWKKLERFLVLGTEGGTYYVDEKTLTMDNCTTLIGLVQENCKRVVDTIVAISDAGRAYKNDPALFALAICASTGDVEGRRYAFDNLERVARIGTHLFHFIKFCRQFRGWGRNLKRGIAKWYLNKPLDKLVFQLLKYQQRDGWSHRDLVILSHPKSNDSELNKIFDWLVNGKGISNFLINNVELLNSGEKLTPETVAKIIADNNLPMEMVPNKWYQYCEVSSTLFKAVGLTALIRNMGNWSKWGALTPENIDLLSERLTVENMRKSRLHPLQILIALKVYSQGQGYRGNGVWEVNSKVVDILDDAYYKSYGIVEPNNKRIMIALDISGSMSVSLNNLPISAREGSACLALVNLAIEKRCDVFGFSTNFIRLDITPRRRLDDNCEYLRNLNFGGTDCSLPMIYALNNQLEYDAFIIYTDCETWAGNIHPFQALQLYRSKMNNPNAKLIVVGMVSSGFSIADPSDKNSLDIVGFDTNTPNLINDFISDKL